MLVLNQFFHPDGAATAQLLTDLARNLASGSQARITAIAAAPSYAGSVAATPNDHDALAGVQTIHTWATGFSRGGVSRVVSYASYLIGSLYNGLRHRDASVVLTLTTPPLLGLVGSLISRSGNARHYIWEMDVYPDVACALDYIRPNRFLSWLLDIPRHRAAGIIALGECMRDRLIRHHGIDPSKIHVIENWADGSSIRRLPMASGDGPLELLYSGNLGLAHDYQTLLDVIPEVREIARFTFAGGGPHRAKFNDLANVTIRPYSALQSLGEHLAACHIGLVTQLPATLGCVVPSKSYGLMAAGRPILFIGPRESTVARNIEKYDCGWVFDCGDASGVANLLRHLSRNRHLIDQAGRNARAAFETHFDRPVAMAKFARVLGLEARSQVEAEGSVVAARPIASA